MSKFLALYESVLESVALGTIRPQSVVVIDPTMIKRKEIADDIIQRKGVTYLAQLQKLANDKALLYVSALKTVRPVNSVYAALPTSNDFQEADVVNYSPGLSSSWNAPMTLPISVLRTIVDPENIMQIPVPGKETPQGQSAGDNSYNDGKQHPNVVGQKEKRKGK